MSCTYYAMCLNNNKCFRCTDMSLLKTKDKKKTNKTAGLYSPADYKTANSDDSWKDLEQKVADSLNKVPDIRQARRSRASGALWFEKGDIVDEILHPECKERKGNELKTGEKSMSIKKEWLTKAANECKNTNKTMCLPFRFKGDDNIYCIFKQEDIAELITTMKAYMHDNSLKERQIKELEEQVKTHDSKVSHETI